MDIQKNNRLIAEFMGYYYYHPGVDIDVSDIGGIYERKEVFSKVPIVVKKYPEDDQYYFGKVPNPDYGKKDKKDITWRTDREFLDWNSLNYNQYITDLKYHESWDWLMLVVEKIESLKMPVVEGVQHFNMYTFIVEIKEEECQIVGRGLGNKRVYGANNQHYFKGHVNGKIKATYEAVVEFIEFYNIKDAEEK